jgi:hypothetical protein
MPDLSPTIFTSAIDNSDIQVEDVEDIDDDWVD